MQNILDKVSFEGFRSFVESRDPKEVINHWGGFAECAIGTYTASLGELPNNSHALFEKVFYKVTYGKPALAVVLEHMDVGTDKIPTFGKLKRLLNKNYRKPKPTVKAITLANLADATPQQVFDQVAKHLLTQGEQAYNWADRSCRYRLVKDDKVLKCAAGCLIGDDEYGPHMDKEGSAQGIPYKVGSAWCSLIKRGDVKTEAHKHLIAHLQELHDSNIPTEWPALLKLMASKYKLTYNADAYKA